MGRYQKTERPQIKEHQTINMPFFIDTLIEIQGRAFIFIMTILSFGYIIEQAETTLSTSSQITFLIMNILLFFWVLKPIWTQIKTKRYYE